ncbi:MAG: hypothetical protein M3040_01330 [Bacteroidota bacterium]|nr:hypothetical protein [Bacteroidota bacterium]
MLDGIENLKGFAKLIMLQSSNLEAVNSLDHPNAIGPQEKEMAVSNNKLSIPLAPYSFSVIRIPM